MYHLGSETYTVKYRYINDISIIYSSRPSAMIYQLFTMVLGRAILPMHEDSLPLYRIN